MSQGNTARSQLTLVPQTFHSLADPHAPPLESWDDRRSSIRRTLSELAWLTQVRVKYGPDVSLIDLSAGGAQIETTSYRLKPGSTVNYTVKREGAAKELTATLGKMPSEVYDTMVAEHMKEHVAVASK